jgi:hypothetical protein
MSHPEHWQLTFKAADAGPAPMAVRVRRALKYALRACGLRCTDHRVVEAGEAVATPPPSKVLLNGKRAATVGNLGKMGK